MQDPRPVIASSSDLAGWLAIATGAIGEKSGLDTVVVDVGDVFTIAEYFVITSGRTTRQVKAIVEEVEIAIKEAGGPSPNRIEGNDEHRWVLMDYGEFLVHVFTSKERDYYQLERLWSDRPVISMASTEGANPR